MRSCTRRAGVIVAFAIAGLFGAPSATADPSVPGDPTGQIYTPPGYIGYYPGVYGLQSIWSLTPPPRVRDAGGTRAMTNADPESAHVGMPGDRLGVQLKHVTVKPHEAGPLGQVFGARPSSPMQQTAVPEAAGAPLRGDGRYRPAEHPHRTAHGSGGSVSHWEPARSADAGPRGQATGPQCGGRTGHRELIQVSGRWRPTAIGDRWPTPWVGTDRTDVRPGPPSPGRSRRLAARRQPWHRDPSLGRQRHRGRSRGSRDETAAGAPGWATVVTNSSVRLGN